jgi:hypothetical protein
VFVYSGARIDSSFVLTWNGEAFLLNGHQVVPRPNLAPAREPDPETIAVHKLMVAADSAASLETTEAQKTAARVSVLSSSPLVEAVTVVNGLPEIQWKLDHGVQIGRANQPGSREEKPDQALSDQAEELVEYLRAGYVVTLEARGITVLSVDRGRRALRQIRLASESGRLDVPGPLSRAQLSRLINP